jgi:uncharacterized protein (TIGR02246 family)
MTQRHVWRLVLAAAVCTFAATVATAQQPKAAQPKAAQPKAAQPKATATAPAPSADEQKIRQGITAFVEQFNAHKADGVAALFAPDARMTFADGTEVNGRDEIKQSFAATFAARPKVAVSVVVDSIRFLTPDVAVEEGFTTMFPDGETLTSRGRYTVAHLKKNGAWLMQSVRVVEEQSLSAYGELQSLEWLVGDWMDEGRTETVEASFKWDENKSFLLEEFRVIRGGDVVLKGTQRIGWDPQAKQIRSWTFDSAGGFGEAVWTPVEDRWVVKAKAVTADGTSATATRTLTQATNDRVIWTATDRLAGDEQLPDLAVTMVRRPPEPAAAE